MTDRESIESTPSTASDRDAFVACNAWFDRKFRGKSDGRFPTFKLALNLLLQTGGRTIVETGCIRQEDDYGAGCSTVLFCEFLSRSDGALFSVDINPQHVALARRLTAGFDTPPVLTVDDSIRFLQTTLRDHPGFSGRIDLLYLDSFDYPLDRLYEVCPPDQLQNMDTETVAARYLDLILPSQEHCLAELEAARDLLHPRSIVLIDDNDLPGGGKSRLARRALYDWGWICLLDLQQTVWIPT